MNNYNEEQMFRCFVEGAIMGDKISLSELRLKFNEYISSLTLNTTKNNINSVDIGRYNKDIQNTISSDINNLINNATSENKTRILYHFKISEYCYINKLIAVLIKENYTMCFLYDKNESHPTILSISWKNIK